MIEIDEIIDVARFNRDGIGYVMMRESFVSNYIRKKVDENTLEFMLGEYLKAYFRRMISNIKGKVKRFRSKCNDVIFKLKSYNLRNALHNWWLFWRL